MTAFYGLPSLCRATEDAGSRSWQVQLPWLFALLSHELMVARRVFLGLRRRLLYVTGLTMDNVALPMDLFLLRANPLSRPTHGPPLQVP